MIVRNTQPADFEGIADLCRRVYPETEPWSAAQLGSHLQVFPEGQFVAVHEDRVVGMCASLRVAWDHYHLADNWEDFTSDGMFTNHDPQAHTLYGAEVLVDPSLQGHGIGSQLYRERRELCHRLQLWRIRAGARLRDYHLHSDSLSPQDYVIAIVHGQIRDATLSFQLHEGFYVLGVVPHYLSDDPESQGFAAVIEWLNPDIPPELMKGRPTTYIHRDVVAQLKAQQA